MRAIFERAAERQEAAREAEDASRAGLTLAELQQIGAAAGIDPAHVAAAATELGRREAAPARSPRWPRQVLAERVLPGPASDDAWEAMVAELRRSLNKPGVAGQVGRTREWTTMSSGGRHPDVPISVTLRPEGAQTRLTILQSWEEYTRIPLIIGGVTSFMTLLLGVIFALWGDPEALVVPAFFAAVALLLFAVGPPALRAMARRQEAKFERVLDRLENVALKTAPGEAAAPAALGEAAPRLGLDAEEPEPKAAPTRRTRTRS